MFQQESRQHLLGLVCGLCGGSRLRQTRIFVTRFLESRCLQTLVQPGAFGGSDIGIGSERVENSRRVLDTQAAEHRIHDLPRAGGGQRDQSFFRDGGIFQQGRQQLWPQVFRSDQVVENRLRSSRVGGGRQRGLFVPPSQRHARRLAKDLVVVGEVDQDLDHLRRGHRQGSASRGLHEVGRHGRRANEIDHAGHALASDYDNEASPLTAWPTRVSSSVTTRSSSSTSRLGLPERSTSSTAR